MGAALRASVRWACIAVASLFVLALLIHARGMVWAVECSLPSYGERWSPVPEVRLAETQVPAATGHLDGLDAELKARYPRGIRDYRVVVRGESPGCEVTEAGPPGVIHPNWMFLGPFAADLYGPPAPGHPGLGHVRWAKEMDAYPFAADTLQ